MLQIEFTHTHIFVYVETVYMYILFFSDRRGMGLGLPDKIITYFECMRACVRACVCDWLCVCCSYQKEGGVTRWNLCSCFFWGGGGEGYGVAWNGIIPVVVYCLIWPAIVLMCWFWTFLHPQLNVRATDRPVLGLTDDSIVNFNINISPIYPVFINAPYNAGTFDETAAVGTVLYNQVSARDADLQVTTSKTVIWVTHFSLLKEQCNDLLLTVIQLLSITAFIMKMPFYSPSLLSLWGCHFTLRYCFHYEDAITVMLLGCGIVEILLNIFINRINIRLLCPFVCRKWEWATFFNNQCSLFSFFFFSTMLIARCYLCDF